MAAFSIYKFVGSLPPALKPNSVYAVRTGAGFDLYIADSTGSVAHKINSEAGGAVPTQAAANFIVLQNTQALFAEPISMPETAWIEIQSGAVLREVC